MVFRRGIFESATAGLAIHRAKMAEPQDCCDCLVKGRLGEFQEDKIMRILSAILVTVMLAGAVSGCVVYGRPYHPWHPCYRCY
jgi:hypothetical protein